MLTPVAGYLAGSRSRRLRVTPNADGSSTINPRVIQSRPPNMAIARRFVCPLFRRLRTPNVVLEWVGRECLVVRLVGYGNDGRVLGATRAKGPGE
jgi:hypothetical protein